MGGKKVSRKPDCTYDSNSMTVNRAFEHDVSRRELLRTENEKEDLSYERRL